MTDRVFLDKDLIKNRPQDRRCMICLERIYMFWIGPEPEPAGCIDNHTDKNHCKHACNSAEIRALGIKAVLQDAYPTEQKGGSE